MAKTSNIGKKNPGRLRWFTDVLWSKSSRARDPPHLPQSLRAFLRINGFSTLAFTDDFKDDFNGVLMVFYMDLG